MVRAHACLLATSSLARVHSRPVRTCRQTGQSVSGGERLETRSGGHISRISAAPRTMISSRFNDFDCTSSEVTPRHGTACEAAFLSTLRLISTLMVGQFFNLWRGVPALLASDI